MGRKLNLTEPKRYSEKIQWYKLYYRNPNMPKCADKWSVRQYVSRHGLESILNDCYGVYDSPEDINWEELPNSFVIKDTLGSGGRSMIFVEDKSKLDIAKAKAKMLEWISTPINKKNLGREWVYEKRKHRIIIERILAGNANGDLPDYKFFCFDGQVFCSYMMQNYTKHHDLGELGFFDRDFKLLPVHRTDFKPISKQPEKPVNYEMMIKYAEVLSKEFPHVRVDFYNINGTIIFGEMTFFNASGYVSFKPDEFDYEMGAQFRIST